MASGTSCAATGYFRPGDEYFYVCPFRVEHLRSLPWGEECFDAFLVALEGGETDANTAQAVAELVERNKDWIETFGLEAEQLHDEVDTASVACGRQRAVGDGSPMTAWHDDLTSRSSVIDYIRRGGHGACDYKLVALVGSGRIRPFLAELRQKLRGPLVEIG